MRNPRCFLRPTLLSAGLLLAGACDHASQAKDAATRQAGTPERTEAGSSALQDTGLSSDGGLSTEGWVDDAGSQKDGGVTLDCIKGGPVSAVHAEFHCGSVTVYTCKDLSNVVLEFEDGHRERFENQSGHTNVFFGTGANANLRVTRVWIKAGANQSGEGPGYGERSDAVLSRNHAEE